MKKHLKRVKTFLIVYTIFILSCLLLVTLFMAEVSRAGLYHVLSYSAITIKIGFTIYILRFIWKYYPVAKKQKRDTTLQVIFLGFIGMWLWYPNEKEMERLNLN